MSYESKKGCLVIIAYNEAENLEILLEELKNNIFIRNTRWELVLIDDGSTDMTDRIALKHGITVIKHPFNLGIGSAEKTGLMFARAKGANIVVRMDGDGQHPPDGIGNLVQEVIDGAADVTIGSRFVNGELSGWKPGIFRRIGIKYFSFLCRLLTGRKILDPTSGFRCYGKKCIDFMIQLPSSDYPEVETIIDFLKAGFIIKEIPIPFRHRRSGRSSIGFFSKIYYMIKVSIAIFIASMRSLPSFTKSTGE